MALSLGVFTTLLAGTPPPAVKSCSFPVPKKANFVLNNPSAANMRRLTCAASATPKAKTEKIREPRGITKPRPVSPEMQDIVGVPEIPRTQALKLIWAYIKQHNLQDPENKKIIICDEKLKKIFKGNDRVGFLEVAGSVDKEPRFSVKSLSFDVLGVIKGLGYHKKCDLALRVFEWVRNRDDSEVLLNGSVVAVIISMLGRNGQVSTASNLFHKLCKDGIEKLYWFLRKWRKRGVNLL
ncbi:hypothetical protein POM88_014170 [Heracleum sosnowskyi]|uniref:DM2 domain-containing protein n=1 Tax=Heracleum sosnowskyi TaxID=360622 RepID=A0AAD8J1G5_9APIA|nr:hypothetical protein POM88_014170 [Heracleum sosnowskyi]